MNHPPVVAAKKPVFPPPPIGKKPHKAEPPKVEQEPEKPKHGKMSVSCRSDKAISYLACYTPAFMPRGI